MVVKINLIVIMPQRLYDGIVVKDSLSTHKHTHKL